MKTPPAKSQWVRGDFSGMLERDLLCLSHDDRVTTSQGETVLLVEGMVLTAFDDDIDENNQRDDIFCSGTVERSPVNVEHRGSRWSLRIDDDGVRWESALDAKPLDRT